MKKRESIGALFYVSSEMRTKVSWLLNSSGSNCYRLVKPFTAVYYSDLINPFMSKVQTPRFKFSFNWEFNLHPKVNASALFKSFTNSDII